LTGLLVAPNTARHSSHPRALSAGFAPPSSAPQAPSGDEWLHEIKHDGFRVIALKDANRVRLYSRPGNDPGCVKTLSGIAAPGILNPVVMRRAKKRKNLSSARH
jgi:hypothetical protein